MPTTLIRGGLVHDAVHRDACKADILLADGKIAAIGTDLPGGRCGFRRRRT